jgi:acetyl esterase/lipase
VSLTQTFSKMFFNRLATAFLVIAHLTLTFCQSTQVSVTIANGTILGSHDSADNIDKFLGIPYAEPPVGDLRLRQAMPLQQSFGTIQASAFGAACYGSRNPTNSSEDCLNINVWRPSSIVQNETLPVLVWIYGGGFTNGYTVRIPTMSSVESMTDRPNHYTGRPQV